MPADPYDILPYPDVVVSTASPTVFGAVALLLGAEPASPRRILELGCGTGANTISIARDWPEAAVIGVDLSARQIEIAQAAAKGIANLTFQQADILSDALAGIEPVDYIVCHGVYSWVPPAVQERILSLAAKLLTKRGAAMISFNILPGWHVKMGLREILRFHTAQFEDVAEKLEQGRRYMELIKEGMGYPESWATQQTHAVIETLAKAPDAYFFHEYLCDFNEPILFEEFSRRIRAAGLQYVGDADFATNVPAALSEETREILMEVSGSRERYEQHLDFMLNRVFRRAIVMRDTTEVTGRFSSSAIARLRFRSREVDVQGDDPVLNAIREMGQNWSTMEDVSYAAGLSMIETTQKMLIGIAEGWVEVRMV